MKNELIEVYRHDGAGYNPYLITSLWQVAQLNHSQENAFYGICRMDVHHHTDESFVLLKGTVVLIAASIAGEEVEFAPELMQYGRTYNIPENCWHNLMMSEDAEVLVVENAHTHEADFEFHYLSDEQIDTLNGMVRTLLEQEENAR